MNIDKKQYRMIYLVDTSLKTKIQKMRKEYHINISSFVRNALENKYKALGGPNSK
jgi:hypothetical protein